MDPASSLSRGACGGEHASADHLCHSEPSSLADHDSRLSVRSRSIGSIKWALVRDAAIDSKISLPYYRSSWRSLNLLPRRHAQAVCTGAFAASRKRWPGGQAFQARLRLQPRNAARRSAFAPALNHEHILTVLVRSAATLASASRRPPSLSRRYS